METLEEMKARHDKEFHELRENCPHNKTTTRSSTAPGGSGREIITTCDLCGMPMMGWRESPYGKGQVMFAFGYEKIREEKNA